MSREIAVTERLISCIKFCLQPQLKYLFFHINTLMVSQPRFLVFPSVFNLSFPPWVAAFTAMSGSSTRRHCQFVNANNLKKSGWLFQVSIGYPSMRRPWLCPFKRWSSSNKPLLLFAISSIGRHRLSGVSWLRNNLCIAVCCHFRIIIGKQSTTEYVRSKRQVNA